MQQKNLCIVKKPQGTKEIIEDSVLISLHNSRGFSSTILVDLKTGKAESKRILLTYIYDNENEKKTRERESVCVCSETAKYRHKALRCYFLCF